MKALLVGFGKMGRAIEAVLFQRGHGVVGRVDRGGSIPDSIAEVAFEFTTPDAAPAVVPELLSRGIPVVSGTTGWDVEAARQIARERRVPFLHAPNFSIGIAVVRRAVASVAQDLAVFREFEPGIVERHHSAKKDAPSGTAKALAAEIGLDVPIVALRQGGQPGEHIVYFEGADESIEIVHRARSRALFASGAVRAAEWLVTAKATGPVTFQDFLDRRPS